ncbi:hypothetical protein O0544_12770 [Edwardsiella anguillarum]|nr:hypothetical protein [Edwardsiella anguillarum]
MLHNDGLIGAGNNASLTARRIESTSGSQLAAGVDAQGGITQPGNLVLTSQGVLKAHGQNLVQHTLEARGSRVDISGSQTSAKNLTLTATHDDVRTAGATLKAEHAHIQAATGFNNDDGRLSVGSLSLRAQSIDNNHGLLRQERTQDLILDSGLIRNNQGTLISGGNTVIRAGRVENRGGCWPVTGGISASPPRCWIISRARYSWPGTGRCQYRLTPCRGIRVPSSRRGHCASPVMTWTFPVDKPGRSNFRSPLTH